MLSWDYKRPKSEPKSPVAPIRDVTSLTSRQTERGNSGECVGCANYKLQNYKLQITNVYWFLINFTIYIGRNYNELYAMD
jgi:hypothetical protein